MLFHFSLGKTIEAAAVILKEHGGRVTRLRLLKLLYIADRRRLAESGRTITGDHPYAMEHGPVLDDTYGLIKGTGFNTKTWDRHFRRDPFNGPGIELADDPGVALLSRNEIETLARVCRDHVADDDWDLSKLTHGFEEWEEVYRPHVGRKASVRIPDQLLLDAVGRGGDRERIEAEADADAEWSQMVASLEEADGGDLMFPFHL